MQQKIISLGKLITQELDLDKGVDTLSKWMAHYLAEKIVLSESLSGNQRVLADQECFKIISEIWKHRWSLPEGDAFLKKYGPLIETLQKLDPAKETSFYSLPELKFGLPIDSDDQYDDVAKSKFDIALEVDRLARTLISDLLHQGASEIKLSEERQDLIDAAIEVIEAPDTTIIQFVTDPKYSQERKIDKREERIHELKERIKTLADFDWIRIPLLKEYQQELAELEKK